MVGSKADLTTCLQVQWPMQGLGVSAGEKDQAAGSPTDSTLAHSWPHSSSQAPAVLRLDLNMLGLADTSLGLPLGGLQLRPGALQRAMSRLAAATQTGALSSSMEGPAAATHTGAPSSSVDGLAAATPRGGLMDYFEKVRTATSERRAGTGQPHTRPDAACRRQQQVSRWRVKDLRQCTQAMHLRP